MKLIVMTKPTFFVEEDKILANLFEEGLENLHLYKPGASPMYSERLLTLLGDDYRNRITWATITATGSLCTDISI